MFKSVSDLRITSESMTGRWSVIKLMIILSFGRSSAEHCDRVSTVQEREGNLGRSKDFNWLGVLQVHLDDDWIATTGIVLIKTKYALAIADDVARIPQNIFKSYSKAMFLAARDTPWFVKLASYVTHPEYEFSNLNTIAVIELDLDGFDDFPLTPICLANAIFFNSSKYLYLTGFTHENNILEKVIYKIQYLDEKVCEERYNQTELSSQRDIPSAHLCGYAPNSATDCVWDNGMTLVSNSFGYLTLMGFSVHGPGCTKPTRFIDLFPYYHWINFITDEEHYRHNEFVPSNGRKAFVPHKKRKGVVSNIPIHELYTYNCSYKDGVYCFSMSGSRRQSSIVHHYEAYPLEFNNMKFHLIQPVQDGNAYLIIPFKEKWEKSEGSCSIPTVVIYQEIFKVTAVDNLLGSATYKLSLYDTNFECLCVRLTVDCDSRSDAILSFKEEINFKEDTHQEGASGDRTPEEILKYFPNPKRGTEQVLLRPSFITDDNFLTKTVLNYDLYITFKFTERAELKFEMLAEKPKPTTSTTTQSTKLPTSTTTEPTELDKKSDRRLAEIEEQTTPNSRWGKDNRKDNILKETDVIVIDEGDVEKLSGTQSAARGEGPALAAGFLISACVLRAFIILLTN